MNEQEVIEELKGLCCEDCLGWEGCANPKECEYYNATNMAIKALENQIKTKQILTNKDFDEDDIIIEICKIYKNDLTNEE